MYTIKTLNAISPVGLAKLPANQFEIDNEAAAPHGVLVRSADMHDAPLPDSLLAIARAGAGTNNIPVEECTSAMRTIPTSSTHTERMPKCRVLQKHCSEDWWQMAGKTQLLV